MDTVVIAGMGGDLTARIVEAAAWLKKERTRLLLQPMTKADHLRQYLYQNGFFVSEEKAVVSGKFVYTVFSAQYDGKQRQLSLLETYIGKALEGNSPDTDRYLVRIRSNLLRRIAGIDQSQGLQRDLQKKTEYQTVIRMLEEILQERNYVYNTADIPEDRGTGAIFNTGTLG